MRIIVGLLKLLIGLTMIVAAFPVQAAWFGFCFGTVIIGLIVLFGFPVLMLAPFLFLWAKGWGLVADGLEEIGFRTSHDGLAEGFETHNARTRVLAKERSLSSSAPSQVNTDAVSQYREAAEKGSADAQFNLGCLYRIGDDVEQNNVKAIYWWEKAAREGDANATFNLGVMHSKGLGVPQNHNKAFSLYFEAVELGSVEALYNIGDAYINGLGVPQNFSLAVKWWEKAAELGFAQAQYSLGVLYAKGIDIPLDHVKAYKWMRLASDSGFEAAKAGRKRLEDSMTDSQMYEANAPLLNR